MPNDVRLQTWIASGFLLVCLINTVGLQEAKDSSEIENIVTTHDELFKDDVLPEDFANPAAKEVLRYRQARASEVAVDGQAHPAQVQVPAGSAGFGR